MTSFEANMVNLMVPNLLNDFLGDLNHVRPSCAKDVVTILKKAIEDKMQPYFTSIVTEFQRYVAQIAEFGIAPHYCLFFSVPQEDGTVVELFPKGSKVAVTSHNVENFLYLYKAFKKGQPYRYTDHVIHLPLSARLNLNSDYTPILDLLDSEIAKWKLDEPTWAMLDVCYCVPRNGVIVNLTEGGRSTRVPHEELRHFVEKARLALARPIAAFVPQPPRHDPRSSPVPAKHSTASTNSPDETKRHYEQFGPYLKAILTCNTAGGQPLSEEEYTALDVHYCVPVMGKIVDLIPNGRNVKVPFNEKNRYCTLAAEKLGINIADETAATLATDKKKSDGVLSPRNYEFELFRPSSNKKVGDAMAQSLTKVLTPDEISFHYKMVLQQLSTGKWTQQDLEALNLHFEVPIDGHLVPLVEGGERIRVTVENKNDFILRGLDALNKGTAVDDHTNIPKKDREEAAVLGLFSPTHFEADLFAPYVPSDQVKMTPNPRPNDISEEEQNFWTMLTLLESGFPPANIPFMNLKFVLKFPNGRIVELKDGGHNVLVTEHNLKEFITLAHAKQEAIHLAFKYCADDTLDPILQFPKEKASDLNVVQLTASDLNCKVFGLVEGLASSEFFSNEEFEQMKLMYCIPLATDKYDLVPDGRNIPVTAKYRDDFVKRVLYERDRLLPTADAHVAPIAVSRPAAPPMPPALTGEPVPSGSMNVAKRSDSGNNSTPSHPQVRRSRSITSIPLTAQQIDSLIEFREKVLLLLDVDFTEGQWNEMGLAWCIRCGELTFDVIPDGTTKIVPIFQREEFVKKCVDRVDEILQDQNDRRNVAVPQAATDEMGLFSPSHFSSDLFAPAQHITTRTAPPITTLPPAPQHIPPPFAANPPAAFHSPAAPTATVVVGTDTLEDFLKKSNCAQTLHALRENGVQVVADLLELQESDISIIVPQVLLRRRLIDALAGIRR